MDPMNQYPGGSWQRRPPAEAAAMVGGGAPPNYSDQVYYPPPLPPPISMHSSPGRPDNPYVKPVAAQNFTGGSPVDMFNRMLYGFGKKVDETTRSISNAGLWGHLKASPNMINATTGRIVHGTRALMEGGQDQLFFEAFGSLPDEQVQKTFACYLSHSTGPVGGTLYLSTARLAFASDQPVCHTPRPGYVSQPVHYRVDVPLQKLCAVRPSFDSNQPSKKYIQIITREGFEFWFMGFISYDKALENLTAALKY